MDGRPCGASDRRSAGSSRRGDRHRPRRVSRSCAGRLFQRIETDKLPDRDATALVFGELYRSQASEFPNEFREPAYVERIKHAYPIHPELFSRLYDDWSTLEQSVADYLSWKQVVDESVTRNLDPQQAGQATSRRDDATRTIDLRLSEAYHWVLVPGQPEPNQPIEWDATRAEGQGSLADRVVTRLVHAGALYADYPPQLLRLELDGPLAPMWEGGDVSVADLWDAHARYIYLHRLRSIDTLCACAAAGPGSTTWTVDGFAVADGYGPRTEKYFGLTPRASRRKVRRLRGAGDRAGPPSPAGAYRMSSRRNAATVPASAATPTASSAP